MKIFFKIILILVFFYFPANSEVIKEIKIDGNQRVSSETVKVFSGVKKNSDLNEYELNDILKKLYSTNYFKNVSINIDNNILYIFVEENPIIQTLLFEGLKNKRILETLSE